MIILCVLIMSIHVKNAKPDSGFGKVSPNGNLDGSETIIGKGVGPCHDGQHVYTSGETSDGVNLRWR